MTLVDRMEYADMRSAIGDIMGTNSTEGDEMLLEEYNKCEFHQFRPKYQPPTFVSCLRKYFQYTDHRDIS